MKITTGQTPDLPVQAASTPVDSKNDRVTSPRVEAAVARTASSVGNSLAVASNAGAAVAVVPALSRTTDVSLRRDNNGRVYYVVSDAKSGQEILEVPPKSIREIGQGIEDYVREAESKAASRLNTKA